jgi:hypothetical protein
MGHKAALLTDISFSPPLLSVEDKVTGNEIQSVIVGLRPLLTGGSAGPPSAPPLRI